MAVIREAVEGWAPTRTRAEKEAREKAEKLGRNGLDGPPLYLCHGCGKIEEGSWSGKRSYPKEGRSIYVAQAIKMAPKGWAFTVLERGSGCTALCSRACGEKYPDAGAMFG
jgi:hypothetical protein